jgi:hypothetical protein
MVMSIDQEYKNFSKWCRDNPAYDLDPRLHTHSGRINDGGYISHRQTGTAFKAWQASRQALEGEPVAWWDGDTSAAEDSFSFKSNGYYRIPLYTHPASANDAKHHAVLQDQIWAQEARTQKAIVKEIGELVGCENDWEMVESVRDALATLPPKQEQDDE